MSHSHLQASHSHLYKIFIVTYKSFPLALATQIKAIMI